MAVGGVPDRIRRNPRRRRRVRADRTPQPPPDARCLAVRRTSLLGRKRIGHRRVLLAVRLHLHDHPVHAVHPRLRNPLNRSQDPAGRSQPRRLRRARRESRRLGTRMIVCTGLVLLGGSFLWIAQESATISYGIIVIQMVMMGSGIGLISTPATESILRVLPPAKAGIGSAVYDATRETGGTLRVAIIGSVYTSIYISRISQNTGHHLPQAALNAAQSSVGAGYAAASHAPLAIRPALLDHRASLRWTASIGCRPGSGAER